MESNGQKFSSLSFKDMVRLCLMAMASYDNELSVRKIKSDLTAGELLGHIEDETAIGKQNLKLIEELVKDELIRRKMGR